MTTRPSKWSALVALLLAAGLVLSGCGGGDDPAAEGDKGAVGEKADTELTKENFFTELTKAQQEAGTSHLTMDLGVAGQSISAEGDVAVGKTPADSAMQLTMDLGSQGGQAEMRLVDKVFYLNFGPLTDNKFATLDLTDESNPATKQFGDILDNVDPAKQLEQLKDAVTSFEKKGAAKEIDGVQAQPYEVVVDGSKVSAAAGLEGQGAQGVPETLTYTMFIGPDNLPRRIATDIAGTSMTLDYSKWGEDVEVEAPAKSEITDKDPFAQMGSPSGA